MYKIAAVGDKDSICGFASLGIHIFQADGAQEAAKTLRRLAADHYAVIYITELLASQITDELDRYRHLPLPAVIPIPGVKGNTGLGMRYVGKSVEQAVGSDIISEDDRSSKGI
ncbi:MAG TPA: V-type ATP synthase subunit F [Clostridiales bacterium]|nr:MAG: V-type sodium ATPase subunit G [Firmicutes bacterium ADurb.Bin262]HOU09256.1 V-type ATP synthase subunit F [Clostridiales bacterium]HQH62986.1 V-type ATP synthase subunit F [Clostridiales bacterium]HQK72706.1 V-type ATP synthase subunit F [Clostridiales bacterium]